MLIGQDEHSVRVKGTPASNLSPSQHLILVVERDDVETESEFDCSPLIQKDSQMKEAQQRKEVLRFFHPPSETTVSLTLGKFNNCYMWRISLIALDELQ